MNNTISWWNNSKIIESFFAPFEESKSLLVSVKFNFFVLLLCVCISCNIDLYGVINNEINLTKRIYLFWVTSKFCDCGSHGSQIYNSRNTSEVLQQNTGRLERYFNILL